MASAWFTANQRYVLHQIVLNTQNNLLTYIYHAVISGDVEICITWQTITQFPDQIRNLRERSKPLLATHAIVVPGVIKGVDIQISK